jgi:ubiquinone biosynthesis monooxygenase Coq7
MNRSPVDNLINHVDAALRTISGNVGSTQRKSPAEGVEESDLTAEERQEVARLMRVNHCGEVCAQALYHGQAMTAQSSRVAGAMKLAAEEETDHLAWTETRIREMDSHVSYLNPLYYAASFVMGAATGLLGDKVNLGYVAATEEEVCRHLEDHLARLPAGDEKSRRILEQMREDEAKHANMAIESGGARFPAPIKDVMRGIARVMTRTSYWV